MADYSWERVEETDEGGNVHPVILVKMGGRELRLSPTHQDSEIDAIVQREREVWAQLEAWDQAVGQG